jgi:hypothetical protein
MGTKDGRELETRGHNLALQRRLLKVSILIITNVLDVPSEPRPPIAPYVIAEMKVSRRRAIRDRTVGRSRRAISRRTFVATAVKIMIALRSLLSITAFGASPGEARIMSEMASMTMKSSQRDPKNVAIPTWGKGHEIW